jgi:hypothetical protein
MWQKPAFSETMQNVPKRLEGWTEKASHEAACITVYQKVRGEYLNAFASKP